MATDRRQGAATLTVGAGLTAGGGVLRHHGVRDAHGGPAPGFEWRHPVKTYPSGALLRRGARGRGKYVAGALMGIAGTPAVAVGGRNLLASNKRVEKAAGKPRHGFTGKEPYMSGSRPLPGARRMNSYPDDFDEVNRNMDLADKINYRRANISLTQSSDRAHDIYPNRTAPSKVYVNRRRISTLAEHGTTSPEVFAAHGELGRRVMHPSMWERLSGAYQHRDGTNHNRPVGERTGGWATSHYVPTLKRPRVRGALVLGAVGGAGAAGALAHRKRVKKAAPKVHFAIERPFTRLTGGHYYPAGSKRSACGMGATAPSTEDANKVTCRRCAHVAARGEKFGQLSLFGKADRPRSFLREGAAGATNALGQRAASAVETPPKAKAVPTAIGVGAGTLGSLAAHRTLDRVGAFKHGRLHSGRAAITATAGTVAAAASFPLARHAMARNKEYEVTPAGVRRRKSMPVRPSKKAQRVDARDRSFRTRQQLVPTTSVDKAIGPKTDARAAALLRRLEERQQRDYGHLGSRRAMFEAYQRDHPTAHSDLFWRAALVKANRRIDPMDREESRKALVDRLQRHQRARMDTALLRRDLGVPSTPPKRRIYKADYPGRTASPMRQRAAIYAAGATPVVGAYAGAHAAAHFAPPGEKKRAAARQFVGGPVAGFAGGAAGAYGMAHLAEHNPKVREFTDRVALSAHRISTKLTDHLPKAPKLAGRTARLREMKAKTIRRVAESKAGRRAAAPLLRRPIAAGVGFYAAKTLVGQTGGNIAIQRNIAAQRRYNAKHPVKKSQHLGYRWAPASELYRDHPNSMLDRRWQIQQQRDYLLRQRRYRQEDIAHHEKWNMGRPGLAALDHPGRNPRRGTGRRAIDTSEFEGPHLRSSTNKRVFYDPSVGRRNRSRLEPQVGRHPLRRPVTVAISSRADDARGTTQLGSRRDRPRVELSQQLWDKQRGKNATKTRSHVLHHELAHANRTGSVHRRGLDVVGVLGFVHDPGLREEGRADAIAGQYSRYRRNSYSGISRGQRNAFIDTKLKVASRVSRVRKFKSSEPPLQTKRQQAQQLRRKQRAVATGALATTAGLAGTGLLVARHAPGVAARFGGSRLERAAINTSIAGGGIGAVNGIQNQRIARRDIKQQRHELARVIKADLQVSIDHKQAKHLTNKYGSVGPLPRTLSRDERKQAYEARYVTGGGPKAAEHQHRARVAGAVQHASNAVAAGSAATLLASRTGRGRAVGRAARGLLARRYPGAARVGAHQVERHAENVGLSGVLAGVASGAASQHAKNKSRKATSMQSGVAAGALRRMQAYEPDRRAS